MPRVQVTIEWESEGSYERDEAMADAICDYAMVRLEGLNAIACAELAASLMADFPPPPESAT